MARTFRESLQRREPAGGLLGPRMANVYGSLRGTERGIGRQSGKWMRGEAKFGRFFRIGRGSLGEWNGRWTPDGAYYIFTAMSNT